MMYYGAKITKQKEGEFLVEFPGLPGCFTEGDTLEDALFNAHEALNGWLAVGLDCDLRIPPRKTRKWPHFYPIEVDLEIAFTIQLRQLRKKRGLSQGQVARKLAISQQAYAKLEAPSKSNPSLSTIQRLSRVLDAKIDIRMM